MAARQAKEPEAADYLGWFYQLTLTLSQAPTVKAIAQTIADQAVAVLGASVGIVALLTPDGAAIEVIGACGIDPPRLEQFPRISLSAPAAFPDAVRRGEPVWLESPDERRRSYPESPDAHHDPDAAAWAILPLEAGGRRLGGLGVTFAKPRRFGEVERHFLVTLAQLVALALSSAQLAGPDGAHGETRDQSREQVSLVHDLKQPLTTLNAGAQFLQRELTAAPPLVQELLTVFTVAIRDLEGMVGALGDLSRLRSGQRLDLDLEPTDLVALAQQEVAAQQVTTTRHHIEVDATAPELVGDWDRERLARVVANLLANAVKYSSDGGLIRVRLLREYEGQAAWARLEVIDSGIGIPAADLPHIFEPFFRSRVVAGRVPGSGIGLAGVKQIVEQHGGSIEVTTAEGRGSCFRVRLPLAPPEPQLATPEVAPPTRAIRLLIADDATILRTSLRALLSRERELEVVGEAWNGQEAILEAERLRPDVVLMDLAMPVMGGLEATRQIRQRLPETQVLALTIAAERDSVLQVLEAGGAGYVRKSASYAELLGAIHTASRGEAFLYPSAVELLLSAYHRTTRTDPGAPQGSGLSVREQEVLYLTAAGYTNTEIGQRLFLSPKTVDTHRRRILEKLGLQRRHELVRYALEHGLLRPS